MPEWCSCQGRNPNCARCNGFGIIRPADLAPPPAITKSFAPKTKSYNLPKGKALKQCPYCLISVSKMQKHIKKCHPEKIFTNKSKKKKSYPEKNKQKSIVDNKKSKSDQLGARLSQAEIFLINKDKPAKSVIDFEFITCSICSAMVRKDLFDNHCRRKHKTSNNKSETRVRKVEPTGRRKIIRSTEERENKEKVINKNEILKKSNRKKIKYIQLENKECQKITGLKLCDSCGVETKITWKYISALGLNVHICKKCRPILLEYSFEKKDALDFAVYGGKFDGNKRRH